MGWAVGNLGNRHIGYGVPATCDQPGCGASIDRGLAYACGGGVVGEVENCGLFFCDSHRTYTYFFEGEPVSDDQVSEMTAEEEAALDFAEVCERCANNEQSFDPTPDTEEWASHVLTDESWAQWRKEEPEWVDRMRKILVS